MGLTISRRMGETIVIYTDDGDEIWIEVSNNRRISNAINVTIDGPRKYNILRGEAYSDGGGPVGEDVSFVTTWGEKVMWWKCQCPDRETVRRRHRDNLQEECGGRHRNGLLVWHFVHRATSMCATWVTSGAPASPTEMLTQ